MDFEFGGELPDDHVFLNRVRPLVDWSFKFISWLVVTATFGVAAEVTNDPWLWGIYFFAHLLLIFFLQTFFSWLFTMRFSGKKNRPVTPRPGSSRFRRWYNKGRAALIAIFAFAIWAGFQVAMQNAIGHAVAAISDFQKARGVK